MKKQVFSFVKNRRLKQVQKVQEQIMNANNIEMIGNKVEIIVDFYDEEEQYYVCRRQTDSPDVDFYLLLDASSKVKIGEFYKVKITNYIEGFFKGEVI